MDDDVKISENTPVKLGLILVVVLGTVGMGAGAVWWAASMQAKLNYLVENVRLFGSSATDNRSKIDELRSRVALDHQLIDSQIKELSTRMRELDDRTRKMEDSRRPSN